MSPNSEDNRKTSAVHLSNNDEMIAKEKQRPPIYNPEDYALSLRKWGRRPAPNGPGLYNGSNDHHHTLPAAPPHHSASTGCLGNVGVSAGCGSGSNSAGNSFRDYRNPMLMSSGSEMTLRQFGTVSELLSKLRNDLRMAYPSFVQEFVADPLDGITLMLELLRAVQLSQNGGNGGSVGPGGANTVGKLSPALQRAALLDELSCLQCILCCCLRQSDTIRKISASSAGLFTLSVCIMSNVNKSRIIALQLLTKACETMKNDNTPISEALSTLRLRFGEPVRFRFLVGMLTSAGGQGELLLSGLKFVNTFLGSCGNIQKRLYVQAELDQAGFDLSSFKKNIMINSQFAGQIFDEMDRWEKDHIDVEFLTLRMQDAELENSSLRDKLLLLERKVQILQEEKGILISLEQCLKERCSELQGEVVSLKSSQSKQSLNKIEIATTPEDEGISSSERSITPEDDYTKYKTNTLETLPIKDSDQTKSTILDDVDDDEEETTIEEVMEELRNIINDAETEVNRHEMNAKNNKLTADACKADNAITNSRIIMRVDSMVPMIADSILHVDNELEIVPSNLHPQPPRKTRSLVHLYAPQEELQNYKEVFFENETAFSSSDESSDSLLSASRYHHAPPPPTAAPLSPPENNNRAILNTIMDARDRAFVMERKRRQQELEIAERHQVKSGVVVKRSESVRMLEQSKLVSTSKLSSATRGKYCPQQMEMSARYDHAAATTQRRNKSKSLDRIDDGLDSMVDIVMTDNHRPHPNQTQLAHNANAAMMRPLSGGDLPVTSLSRSVSHVFAATNRPLIMQQQQQLQQQQQQQYANAKMFLPGQARNEDRSNGETRYYFPRLQAERRATSSSFLIRRGHGNAGMYSGQQQQQQQQQLQLQQAKANVVNARKADIFATAATGTGSRHSSSKVTDFPSGLY